MAEEEKASSEEGANKGGGLKALLIPILASAVTAAIVGFVMVFLLAPKPQAPAEGEEAAEHGGAHGEHGEKKAGKEEADDGKEPAEKKHTGQYHQYESFVVSIFDREKVHYLRIKVALEVSNPEIIPELEAKDPQIKDSMIFVLGDFTVRELLDNQAKLLVKEVLLKTLNKILGKGKVVDIYFTEFVVQ
jgi:flagellar FliL protein